MARPMEAVFFTWLTLQHPVVTNKLIIITQTNLDYVHYATDNFGAGPNYVGHTNNRLMVVTELVVSKTATSITVAHGLPIDTDQCSH